MGVRFHTFCLNPKPRYETLCCSLLFLQILASCVSTLLCPLLSSPPVGVCSVPYCGFNIYNWKTFELGAVPAQNWGGNDRLSFTFSTCVTSGVIDSWNLLSPKSLFFWSLSSHWRTPITVIVRIGWGQVFSMCWWVLSQVRISIWNSMSLWLHFRDCWSRTPKQKQASHSCHQVCRLE